jgi:hypothetical protein
MKPKVVIEIRGGAFVGCHSTHEIEIYVVDYDNKDHGGSPVHNYRYCPDTITDNLPLVYADDNEVYQDLKRIIK